MIFLIVKQRQQKGCHSIFHAEQSNNIYFISPNDSTARASQAVLQYVLQEHNVFSFLCNEASTFIITRQEQNALFDTFLHACEAHRPTMKSTVAYGCHRNDAIKR